ncbi:MAG: TrkH family potassium uptake protein [Candidatus Aminicenantales bacterium]
MIFLLAIAAGCVLLMIPVSTRAGRIPFIDALFTSTSAVCVTGLVVVDTSAFFSRIGQAVILSLIQLGGLGVMIFSSLVLLVAGGRVSFKDRLLIQDNYLPAAARDIRSIVRNVFAFTLILEGLGALALFLRFRADFSPARAMVLAVFHSVSAFCNAGFSLFSRNLADYRGDWAVNLTVMILIVLGGLGFFVLRESAAGVSAIWRKKRTRLSLHSKLVFAMTAALIFGAAALLLAIEHGTSMRGFPLGEKILASSFQVVTARTAGFNTMDLATLGPASVALLCILMFIGASPGSTGGGVKTTTVGVLLAFLRSRLTARSSAGLFRRTIPADLIVRAYILISLAACLIFSAAFAILVAQPELGLQAVLFEVFSAFGTVGISLGITPQLNAFSKVVLIVMMYIGRIGPLTLLYVFTRTRSVGRYAYAEEGAMIG